MISLLTEYRRPWKLATLVVGIGLLILGAFYYEAPDWDIPISFIMAIFAYLTAPWSPRVILERKWRLCGLPCSLRPGSRLMGATRSTGISRTPWRSK